MNKKRILYSTETKTGNLSEDQKIIVRDINENPTFDKKTKPYKYIKNFKTNTTNYGWLFEFNGKIFAAMHVWMPRYADMIIIFNANQKGDFSIEKENEVKRYVTYVDIEHAVDTFVSEFKDI